MHFPSLLVCACTILLTGCRPALEKKLVGEWLSGCSIDICTLTMLSTDHTFSQRFDEKDFPPPNFSGTWRIEGDQLVLHVAWANKSLNDILGKDMRFIISEFDEKKFVATPTEGPTKPVTWERRH
jgi:hypothetical protein